MTAVLASLRREAALPDLKSVSVIVDTSTEHGRAGLTAAEVTCLRVFMEGLIAASGGHLIAYGPSAGTTSTQSEG